MNRTEADYDNALIRSGEESGTPTVRPDQMCEICGRFFYELYTCEGCGEVNGCENCMYSDPNHAGHFCDVECVRELERKEKHLPPDFDGILK